MKEKYITFTFAILMTNISMAEDFVTKIIFTPANLEPSGNSSIRFSDDCISFKDFKDSYGKSFKDGCKTDDNIIFKCPIGLGLGSITAIKANSKKSCNEIKILIMSYKLNNNYFDHSSQK